MTWAETLKGRVGRLTGGLFTSKQSRPAPGLYSFKRESDHEKAHIHLRIDPDGQGLMMVNANHIFHLNPTAAAMAYFQLQQIPENEALDELTRRYRISKAEASADYRQVADQVEQLIRPDGPCPICDLELETTLPFSARPSAPYRMDLALTYRCNNACAHCYNARPRNYPEMKTNSWLQVIDRLWEIGIPHVVFTGGEPTLRDDLPELVARAQANGQITGLNTNARRLSDPNFLSRLIDAGLDHVQITVESHDPAIHDGMVKATGAWRETIAGLRAALASPLYVMTNTTLTTANSPFLTETLDFLAEVGVPTIGLNSLIYSGRGLTVGTGLSEAELTPLLNVARDKTTARGQRLIWYTPTEYCHFDPMQMDLGVKGCTAALYNMCVEPDGAVIPCQSYYQPLGNLLDKSWDSIWNSTLAVDLRERRGLPAGCQSCALLAECGGGCPLSRQAQPAISQPSSL